LSRIVFTLSPPRPWQGLCRERGVEVDHVTIYRWVLRFTPLLAEAAQPCRHAVEDYLAGHADIRVTPSSTWPPATRRSPR
jgi:hypothetical protein